jgi:hypothetical protein
LNFGKYKSSAKAQYTKELMEIAPQCIEGVEWAKGGVQKVCDVYRGLRPSSVEAELEEVVQYMMKLPHFNARTGKGERTVGVVGKKAKKEKDVKKEKGVICSLNFGQLRIFKEGALTPIEAYDLVTMGSVQKQGHHSLTFEHDVSGTLYAVSFRFEDASVRNEFVQVILDRLRQPRPSGQPTSRRNSIRDSRVRASALLQQFEEMPGVSTGEFYWAAARATVILFENRARSVLEAFKGGDLTGLASLLHVGSSWLQHVDPISAAAFAQLTRDLREPGAGSRCDEVAVQIREICETVVPLAESDFAMRPPLQALCRALNVLRLFATWICELAGTVGPAEDLQAVLQAVLVVAGHIQVYIDNQPLKEAVARVPNVIKTLAELLGATESDGWLTPSLQVAAHAFEQTLAAALETTGRSAETPVLAVSEIIASQGFDPRETVNKSLAAVSALTNPPLSMAEANKNLRQLRDEVLRLLAMAPVTTHGPTVVAFNELKGAVEASFATNGRVPAVLAAQRCEAALRGLFDALNPAKELLAAAEALPQDERVAALVVIIKYLDVNGPLFNNSPSHEAILHFIRAVGAQDVSGLTDAALLVELCVPERMRRLADKCDRTKGLYKELEAPCDPLEIGRQLVDSAASAIATAVAVKQQLRARQARAVAEAKRIDSNLSRLVAVFEGFAAEEGSGSRGFAAWKACASAFRTLGDEAVYELHRDPQFGSFLELFQGQVRLVVADPRNAEALVAFYVFLVQNETRPGFWRAAAALRDFIDWVIVDNSNRAAERLLATLTQLHNFKSLALTIATLKRRFAALKERVDHGVKSTVAGLGPRSVDLRVDFQRLLAKFTDDVFLVFSRMIVAQSTNALAIYPIEKGCDALERLCPLILAVEVAGPYLSRAACGILFAAVGGPFLAECKALRAEEGAERAFLAVREFMFMVRRKTAQADAAAMADKTGVGIQDMLAVLRREKRIVAQQAEYQRTIRPYKFFDSYVPWRNEVEAWAIGQAA